MDIVNIALIGENFVGKTSIIRSYIDENKTERWLSIPTIFLKKTIKIDGHMIELRLWDSAKSEKAQNMIYSFKLIAHGILLVFDLTNKNSFNHLEDIINIIIKNIEDLKFPIVLIGNKSDLVNQREVCKEDIEKFSVKYNLHYFEISIENKENLDNSIIYIATEAYHHIINKKK